MSPYPEIIEVEGSLVELGVIDGSCGVLIDTENGPIAVHGLDELAVKGLAPGIYGRVRLTIEPIDEEEGA